MSNRLSIYLKRRFDFINDYVERNEEKNVLEREAANMYDINIIKHWQLIEELVTLKDMLRSEAEEIFDAENFDEYNEAMNEALNESREHYARTLPKETARTYCTAYGERIIRHEYADGSIIEEQE